MMDDFILSPGLVRIILIGCAVGAFIVSTIVTAATMAGRKDTRPLDASKTWAAMFGAVFVAGLLVAALVRWAQPAALFLTGFGS